MSSVTTQEQSDIATQSFTRVGLPPGDYRLVGWDMDTTGKKLVDEICQIAGYTHSSSYFQYVMPYRNLNPTAIKRHNIKVVTIGKYRMLKDNRTNKVIKTKSEISALTDFLTWLESVKGDAADGVILLYHEPRKVIPAMLIESLKKYNLLEKFKDIVKGFVNGFNITEAKCKNSISIFSLRTVSRTFLQREDELDNARDRATLAFNVLQYINFKENVSADDKSGSGDGDGGMKRIIEFIREFVQPTHVEEEEHATLKIIFERQNSLKPIFSPLFGSRKDRQHASPLRRLLAEAGIEYLQLQEAWSNGKKEGIETLIKDKLVLGKDKRIEELIKLLECYFDPEKKAPVRYEKKETKEDNSKLNIDLKNKSKYETSIETLDSTSNSVILKFESSTH